MPRYTVQHSYAAERSDSNLTTFGPWAKGDEVEVDEADADWVSSDSVGTLKPAPKSKAADPAAEFKPAKKASAKRAGDAHSSADASGLTKGG